MQVTNISQSELNMRPSFDGNNLYIKQCNYILNRVSEFTPQSYDKMSFLSKFFLRKCTPLRMQELAKTVCDTAFRVKQKFDKKCGASNYMIIAIGRSIASVSETLNFIGGESVVIPLSGLGNKLPSQIPDIDVYRKYLEKIGLTKDKIRDNPNKKFILMDYSVSGDSLMTAKDFLEKPELLDKSENFIDYEINPIVKSLKALQLFYYERFKNYSPVGKLPLENLKDVFIQSDSMMSREGRGNICQYGRKLFLFNILDSLKREDFHDFIPQKEFEYIRRFESPEYMERTMSKTITNLNEQINNFMNLTKNF